MTHHTEAKTIILPSDVDDPNGYGAKQALELCGIDRDTEQTLADMIEERWWNLYRRHAAEALTAAGWTVVLADGSIGSPQCDEAERRHADDLAEVDGLPCDMVAVSHAATDDLWAWWQANAEALIAKHGAPRCVVCGGVEETCDCVLVGQSPAEVVATIAERGMGRGITDAQADAMIELLADRGWLAENDNGLWFLADIQPGVWADLVEQAVQPPASPTEIWREVVDNEVQDRKVTLICKGYAWESHRDSFEPDATDEDALTDAARQAIDAWLAMTPAERAAR